MKEIINVARMEKVDALLAIGGGSVLDSTKAIAVGVNYNGDVWDFFIGKGIVQNAIPLFSIRTLAATGSEMNMFGVVTNEETKEKFAIIEPSLFPKVSVINPDLMATVSKEYLAYTAVDVFAHCLDLYLSAEFISEYNLSLIENILKTVVTTTEKVIENPQNYDARAELAWASTMALNGNTFVGAYGNSFDTHIIEHAMSDLFNVAHGAGLAVTLPAWMRWHKNTNLPRYERLVKELYGTESVEDGIKEMENWFKKIGAPITSEEAQIPRNTIPSLAENAMGLAAVWGMDKIYSKDSIIEILELA